MDLLPGEIRTGRESSWESRGTRVRGAFLPDIMTYNPSDMQDNFIRCLTMRIQQCLKILGDPVAGREDRRDHSG